MGGEAIGQSMQGLVGHREDLGFYSVEGGSPQRSFDKSRAGPDLVLNCVASLPQVLQ